MAISTESLVRKTVTILFCDVVGSTSLGERIDPETTRRVMLRYFDETRTVLERHGGTVEKFIGDAVVAVFGVPVLHEDDALRAVRAADELRDELETLNRELDDHWGIRLEWRIGINTGEVVVGDPTSRQTIASGDTVNVAARLQHAAQPGEILMGKETYRLVRDRIRAGPLTSFALKGKGDEVKTWRLEEIRAGTESIFRRIASPLVGREAEQLAFHDLYRTVLEEQSCQLVTLLGPAGIGKTRLAQEIAARLFGATVAFGRCLPYGDAITFWPVVEIVRALTELTADDDVHEARRRLAALLPETEESLVAIERVLGILGLGGEARSEESFWALRRLFEAVARERPLVLVLEDLQWAEPTLLDLIEYLVGWSRGSPILIVCLARPELLEQRGAWPGARVVLDRLDRAEARTLLANVLGSGVLDEEVARRLAAAADGNPLFLEELVRMLLDDGVLAQVDGRWVVGDLDAIAIPPSISALLSARLDQLAPDERAVLQCASVIGKQFWWSAVADLAPATMRERVGAQLHALVRKRLIVPAETTTFAGEDSFRFEHILVRDAAYATLPKMMRAEMHEGFADWLGRRTVDQPEILGHHLEQAYLARAELGRPDDAAELVGARAGTVLAQAGRRAFAREDMSAAARLLGRAVALMPDSEERREALRERSAALWVVGERESADRLLDELLADSLAAGDTRLEWHARLDQAGRTATRDGLDTVAREAIAVFEQLGDDIGLARAWRRISSAAVLRGSFDEAKAASEQALEHARAAHDAPEEARNVDRLCTALLFGPTPALEGIQRCEELLVGSGANTLLEANVLCSLAGLQAIAGDLKTARASYGRARVIYEALGLRLLIAGLTQITGPIELLAGNPDGAEAELRLGAEILSELGHSAGLAVQLGLLAEAAYAQGEREAADRWASRAEEATQPNELHPQLLWRSVRAKLLGGAGVDLAAEAVALVAPTDAVNLHADARATLATTLRAAGRETDAAVEAREALALYERKGNILAARALVSAVTTV